MRVLLSLNDPTSRKSIKALLEAEGYHVLLQKQGDGLITRLAEEDFAFILMDLCDAIDDSLQQLQRLRTGTSVPLVIVTHQSDTSLKVQALDIGVDDYVVTPFDSNELLARLRMVVRRASGRASRVIALGPLKIDEGRREIFWYGNLVTLARREYALLVAFANHPDRVLTRAYLEQVLYGCRDEVDSNALEVHVHHLRRKIDARLINTIRGVGYRLNRPSDDEKAG